MNTKKIPYKKSIRLKDYDYSAPGYYFITLCTDNRKNLLGAIAKADFTISPSIELSKIGKIINESILNIPSLFKDITVDSYTIMPNHIHLIIVLNKNAILPLHEVISRVKRYTTNQYNTLYTTKGILLWQSNYYEHIIRNPQDLDNTRLYIATNPLKWSLDEYFISS